MKRIAMLFASGLLILSLAVAGCGAQSATDDNAPDTAAKAPDTTASSTGATASGKAPITIGVVTSQTGSLSVIGKQAEMGVRQAAQEWKAKTGQDVQIIVEDDAGTPDGAKAAYAKLVQQKPVAIAAPSVSPLAVALMDSVKQAQIPTIICPAPNRDPAKHGGWDLQVCAEATSAGPVMASFAMKDLGAQKPVLLYSNTPGSKEGAALLTPAFQQAGLPLVATVPFTNDQDLPAALDQVKASGADLMVVWGGPVDSIKVSVAAKQKNLNMPIFGNTYFGTSDYINTAGAASEGVYAIAFSFVGLDDSSQPFVDAVHKNYPDIKVTWTVGAYYDGTMLILNAIQKAGSTDPNKVRDAVLATKDYKGMTGAYSFDPNGIGMHQFVIGKWQGKKLTDIKAVSNK